MIRIGTFSFSNVFSRDCNAPRKLAEWAANALELRAIRVTYMHTSRLPWMYCPTSGSDRELVVRHGCDRERKLLQGPVGTPWERVVDCGCEKTVLLTSTSEHIALIEFRPRRFRCDDFDRMIQELESLKETFRSYGDEADSELGREFVEKFARIVASLQHIINIGDVGYVQHAVMEMYYLCGEEVEDYSAYSLARRMERAISLCLRGKLFPDPINGPRITRYLDEATVRAANGDTPEDLWSWMNRIWDYHKARANEYRMFQIAKTLAANRVTEQFTGKGGTWVWVDPVERERALRGEKLWE